MENYWIERDSGQIVGMFANEQYPGQEMLDENHPDIVAFFAARAQKEADRLASEAAKKIDIDTKMPSRAQIEAKFDSIKANAASAATLTELKIALAPLLDLSKEHAMVTYWLSKNSAT